VKIIPKIQLEMGAICLCLLATSFTAGRCCSCFAVFVGAIIMTLFCFSLFFVVFLFFHPSSQSFWPEATAIGAGAKVV